LKKILVIIGTRPEAIKLAPIIHRLRENDEIFTTKICFTGQHQEMLYQAADHFDIEPDFDLKLMKKGQTLSQITASLVKHLQAVVEEFNPDEIIVQGDTTSAFIGSLIGYYNKIKVGHVEAGLRTLDKFAPFPEEMNRRLVGVLADHHFAPTKRALEALLKEDVPRQNIILTGNTVIDALLYTLDKIEQSSPSVGELENILINGKKMVLITGHRRENFGEGFANICQAIHDLAQEFTDVNFICLFHINI